MRHRTPLDEYDIRPAEMTAYLRYNGWHFDRKLCDWAVAQMRRRNATTGKSEKVEAWTKEQVDEMLTKYNVTLENNVGYDYVYVANMAKADYYKSSLLTDDAVAKFIKDYVDDVDQADGFILNRFYADCVRRGLPIPWADLV